MLATTSGQVGFFDAAELARPLPEGSFFALLAEHGGRIVRDEDFAAGQAPILYLQPEHDPLAHVEDAEAYQRQFGERVSIVVVERASHAVIAEQPDAVSAALVAYARKLWPGQGA